MKKFLILISISLLISNIYSQNFKIIRPGSFNSLIAFGSLNIELVKSGRDSVIVRSGEVEVDDIKIKVEEGNLKISLAENVFSGSKQALVVVYYKNLQGIALRGGAQIADYSLVTADNMELLAGSGSVMQLKLDVKKLKASVGQGSTMSLEGSCLSQDVEVTTGGIYNSYDLKTDSGAIRSNTGGIAKVYCVKYLEANASTGGEISYRGEPVKMKEKTILGGKVERVIE